ncbi:hypothetical protein C2W63_02269 [Bacillus velezensis]|nr:hypothetical protein C2W63_02269 [Bacillus velezensis]
MLIGSLFLKKGRYGVKKQLADIENVIKIPDKNKSRCTQASAFKLT